MFSKKIVNNFIIAVVFVLSISGCSSTRTLDKVYINKPVELSKHIEVGDEISIEMKNGSIIDLTVKSLNSDVITGEDVTVSIVDINKIEKQEFSILKTGGVVLGIISIVLWSCCLIVS